MHFSCPGCASTYCSTPTPTGSGATGPIASCSAATSFAAAGFEDEVHIVEEVSSFLELIEVSSNEGEMEPEEEEGEHEAIEEGLGHDSDPEDEDLEMQDFDNDSGEEDVDSSDPNYNPFRDR